MVSTSRMKKGMTGKETKDLASKTLTQLEQHGFDISNKGEVDRLIDATVKEFRGHERSEAEQEVYDFMQSKLHMSISGAGAAELWDPSGLEAPLIKTKRGDTEAQNVQKFTETWVSKELSKKGINYGKEMEKYDAAKKAYAKSDGMDIEQLYVMKETIGNLHRAMNKLDANKYKKDVTAYLRTQPVVKAPGETFGRSRVHEYVDGFKKHVSQLNAIAYQAGQVAEGITPGRKTRTPSRKSRGEEMLARIKATPVREIKFKGGRTVDVDALIIAKRLSKEKKGKVRAREPETRIARAKAKKYTGEKITALREKAERQKIALKKRAALKEAKVAALEKKKATRRAKAEKMAAEKEAKVAALKAEKRAKVKANRQKLRERKEEVAALKAKKEAKVAEKRAKREEILANRKVAAEAAKKKRLAKLEVKEKKEEKKRSEVAEIGTIKPMRMKVKKITKVPAKARESRRLPIKSPDKKPKERIALTGREAVKRNNRELERLVSTLEERAPEISEWKKVAAKLSTYTEGQKEGARKRLAKFTKDYERAGELAGKTPKDSQVDYSVRDRANPILKRLREAKMSI